MHIMVTGAARGIGAAVVDACRGAGYRVTACDIDQAELEARYLDDPGVTPAGLDVSDAGAWEVTIDNTWQQAPVDVLINVAGVLRAGVTGELIPSEVALQINVNVLGVIYGMNAAARRMCAEGRGHIINVGSTSCLFAVPGNGVYAASKHAVRGFTIAAAGDLRPKGVAVSLVCPGAVKTEMLEQQRGDERAALSFESGRALDPREVAAAVVDTVIEEKPLELYLPKMDQWKGRLCTAFPELFLSSVAESRKRGIANFNSPDH